MLGALKLPVSVTLKAYDLTDKFYGEKRRRKEQKKKIVIDLI